MSSDKVLISSGFGAGWSTWGGKTAAYIARYEPIIEFLEQGGKFVQKPRKYHKDSWQTPWLDFEEPGQSILKQLCEECQEKFGEMPYLGGAGDLEVQHACPGSPVYEYDGNESLSPFGGGTYV